MNTAPRVPFDTLEDISASCCEPPIYYRNNDLNGPVPLDVPLFPPASEWTAVNLLAASRLTHRAAARFSWACVRISNEDDLETLIRTVEEAHIYPGETRPMRDHIRCLELWSNGRDDWSIAQLFSQGGENIPNLEILIIAECLWCLDLEYFWMRLEGDHTPFPFPYLFPSSLHTLLLSCAERPVSITELTMISIQAPNLTKLQVAAFWWDEWDYDRAQVLDPSYRFQHLQWLAVGALVAGPDERPEASFLLSNLLEVLSMGSGMPLLRRFDILGVYDVPPIFGNLYADRIKVATISSTRQPSMDWTPTLQRFRRLEHLVMVMGANSMTFPLGQQTLKEITFSRLPLPQAFASQQPLVHLMAALTDLVNLLPYFPALTDINITVDEGFLPSLGSVEHQFRERNVVIHCIHL